MVLPDCYDAVYQEERRQALWDRWDRQFPVCGCCGRTLRGGQVFYELDLPGGSVILCEECREEMEEHVGIVEEVGYGEPLDET